MKVLFAVPKTSYKAQEKRYLPLGVAYLASYLRQFNKNLQIKIVDYNIQEYSTANWIAEIDKFHPDIVAVSLLSCQFLNATQITQVTGKYYPDILTVMGGHHATVRPSECIEHCDVVVRGEGEQTLNEVVRNLQDFSGIRGVSYQNENGQVMHNPDRNLILDLDKIPYPAYDLLEMEKYSKYPLCHVMGSRGCPFNCSFCSSATMWKQRLRTRSPSNIMDEIELLRTEYGCKGIMFHDDTFNVPLSRGIELCEEIINRGLHKTMFFECQLRVDAKLVSARLFAKLKEANFTRVMFGVESGSCKVVRAMNKQTTVQEAHNAIRLAQKHGLNVTGFFMVGNWNETVLDYLKTLKFIVESSVHPAFSICTPFPETGFYRELFANNFIAREVDWSKATTAYPLVRTNKMTKRQIYLLFVVSNFLFGLRFNGVQKLVRHLQRS